MIISKIVDKKKELGFPIDKYLIAEDFENKLNIQNYFFRKAIDFIYEFFRFNKNYSLIHISENFFVYEQKTKKIKDWI